MSHYHHLTISERESIWEKYLQGNSLREIARCIGRNVSTISRELSRNKGTNSYRPSKAHDNYRRRRKRCRRKLLLNGGPLRDTVARLLAEEQWSPEQISKRLAIERGSSLVSYCTIYRALKKGIMEPKGNRKKNRYGRFPMEKHLRRKGWRGNKKSNKTPIRFVHQTIEQRPKEAEDRLTIGHWEGDLVYSSFHKVYIVTLVERCSRFLLTDVCCSKKPEEIAKVMLAMLKGFSPEAVRSVTLDRGAEFANHSKITDALPHVQFYFAHPSSPWERGSNENTNGLLRQYVPKHTYKRPFSRELLAQFTHKLNCRPRKCLCWKTPFEVFHSSPLHLT